MSGGSNNYICYRIEEDLCNQMRDLELNDLIKDIVKLAHDLEWMNSGDICEETYFKTVKEFKDKWFGKSRKERLEGYIDQSINELRSELRRLINS